MRLNAHRLLGLSHHTNDIDIVTVLGIPRRILHRQVGEERETVEPPILFIRAEASQIGIRECIIPYLARFVPRVAPQGSGSQVEGLVRNARVDMYASPLSPLVREIHQSDSAVHLHHSLRHPADRHSHPCVPPEGLCR